LTGEAAFAIQSLGSRRSCLVAANPKKPVIGVLTHLPVRLEWLA
jgi:hypothetical protein